MDTLIRAGAVLAPIATRPRGGDRRRGSRRRSTAAAHRDHRCSGPAARPGVPRRSARALRLRRRVRHAVPQPLGGPGAGGVRDRLPRSGGGRRAAGGRQQRRRGRGRGARQHGPGGERPPRCQRRRARAERAARRSRAASADGRRPDASGPSPGTPTTCSPSAWATRCGGGRRTPMADGAAPGTLLVKSTLAGTGGARRDEHGGGARRPIASARCTRPFSGVLFVVGTGALLWAYALGVSRSRTELINVPGLFLLARPTAPEPIRRALPLGPGRRGARGGRGGVDPARSRRSRSGSSRRRSASG